MAAGDIAFIGPQLRVAGDSTTTDVAEWDVTTSRCEIVSVLATGTVAYEFSIQDTANNHLLQALQVGTFYDINISYPPGQRPILAGLTIDTPTAAGTMSFQVVYRDLG